MKWGVRRYQNKDGTLTPAGKRRKSGEGDNKNKNTEAVSLDKAKQLLYKHEDRLDIKKLIKENDEFAEYFSDKERKEAMATSSDNTDQLKTKMNNDLKPYIDKLKKLKYGSDEWFEERDAYFDKLDSFGKEWAEATLKDMNVKLKDAKDTEKFAKYIGVGEGYVNSNSDYRSIVDPVTGERDYGLEPSQSYKDKKLLKRLVSNGNSETEAKNIQNKIRESEKRLTELENSYWDTVGDMMKKYDNDYMKAYSDSKVKALSEEKDALYKDVLKLYSDNKLL